MAADREYFRRDINGLRALAVIVVLLFHFGVPGFEGGFIGVDVFFVISGFLMTRIIVRGLEAKGSRPFSVWQFYMARARRIVPALAFLCAVLLAVGWFSLASAEYKQLATHSLFSLAFLSNIRYFAEAGYFDAASHDKWLLHTWSLSVEWQFYLLLPLLLLAVWKLFPGRSRIILLMAVSFLASFLFSVILTRQNPEAGFFLLPTRAWQMCAGGLVFLLVRETLFNQGLRHAMEGAGVALILVSAMFFSPTDLWPGWLAIFPVTGTVLVLLAANQCSAITGNRIAQLLGRWSYSIYLWHWPLYAALVYLQIQAEPIAIAAAALVSVLLGWFSFTFIENFAGRAVSGMRQIYAPLALGAIAVMAAGPGLMIWQNNGLPNRMPPAVEAASREAFNFNERRVDCHASGGLDFPWCTYGGDDIRAIVVGDSHASTVVTAIQDSLASDQQGVLASSYRNCPTLLGARKNRPDLRCAEYNEWLFQQLQDLPADLPLIIVNRTSSYAFGEASMTPTVYFSKPYRRTTADFLEEFRARLITTACGLAENRSVYLVRPFPEMPVDVPRAMTNKLVLGRGEGIAISKKEYRTRHDFVWQAQDAARAKCGVRILDPVPYLCGEDKCRGTIDSRPLYYDDNHLSEYGNRFLLPMFTTVFGQESL